MDTQGSPPLILALETSSETGGVALYQGRLLGEVIISGPLTYSRRLLPALDFLLRYLGREREEIQALAVSIGPGSFTGLRIGLATAKGLALALKIPLLPVNTLEALAALCAFSPYPVCPVLDARRGEIYTALYAVKEGIPQVLQEPRTIAPHKWLACLEEKTIFIGDGLESYKAFLKQELKEKFVEAPEFLLGSRASAVAYLGARLWAEGRKFAPQEVLPQYLRPSEAERKKGICCTS